MKEIWKSKERERKEKRERERDKYQQILIVFMWHNIIRQVIVSVYNIMQGDNGLLLVLVPNVFHNISLVAWKTLGIFIKSWMSCINLECPNFSTKNINLQND